MVPRCTQLQFIEQVLQPESWEELSSRNDSRYCCIFVKFHDVERVLVDQCMKWVLFVLHLVFLKLEVMLTSLWISQTSLTFPLIIISFDSAFLIGSPLPQNHFYPLFFILSFSRPSLVIVYISQDLVTRTEHDVYRGVNV